MSLNTMTPTVIMINPTNWRLLKSCHFRASDITQTMIGLPELSTNLWTADSFTVMDMPANVPGIRQATTPISKTEKDNKHYIHHLIDQELLKLLGTVYSEGKLQSRVELRNFQTLLLRIKKGLTFVLVVHTGSNFILIVVARAISNFSKNHTVLICKI